MSVAGGRRLRDRQLLVPAGGLADGRAGVEVRARRTAAKVLCQRTAGSSQQGRTRRLAPAGVRLRQHRPAYARVRLPPVAGAGARRFGEGEVSQRARGLGGWRRRRDAMATYPWRHVLGRGGESARRGSGARGSFLRGVQPGASVHGASTPRRAFRSRAGAAVRDVPRPAGASRGAVDRGFGVAASGGRARTQRLPQRDVQVDSAPRGSYCLQRPTEHRTAAEQLAAGRSAGPPSVWIAATTSACGGGWVARTW